MARIDDAIRIIREIDASIEAIEAETNAKVAALKAKRSVLEVWFNKQSLDTGQTSFKSAHGVVFWTTTAYCSVADWDAVFKYIKDNNRWDLLTKGVAKKAITDIVQATGEVPPGLTYGSRKTINVRKPTVTA